MKIFKSYIVNIRKPFLLISSIAGIIILGFIDFASGTEISFSIFYLIPIMIISWARGSLKGLLCAIIASITWFIAEKFGDKSYSNSFYPLWNTIMRFVFYFIVILLIQKINKLHKKTEEHSKFDYLTGFYNIRSFYERLALEKERFSRTKRYFSLAYIDIDNFKQVNDTYGHQEGNKLLKTVSQTINASIRKLDIPARIGGDEFVILFVETDENEVSKAFDKIILNLNKALSCENWGISFSVGLITFHKVLDSVEEMIKISDDLMYRAKKEGKDRIYKEIIE